jgi:hypothetical protein
MTAPAQRGIPTSCGDDKLEAYGFFALFGIRGDFHYIVFSIALMETDPCDGLLALCFMICYSFKVISSSGHIKRSSRGLLLQDEGKGNRERR